MRAPNPNRETAQNLFWDLLTFERLMTGPVIHLIYWAGLGMIALAGFGVIGAAIGIAIRGGSFEGVLLAIPMLIGGLLMIAALVLLWRAACEFLLAIMRIAEDIRYFREANERDSAPRPPRRVGVPEGQPPA